MPVRLRSLNPFKGLPNPKEVWAWGMFDLANQSFTLLIITVLFPLYLRNVVTTTESAGEQAWGLMHGISLLVVVLVSPVLGALADARAWRKELLIGCGVACAVLTCCLAFVGPGGLWIAVLLYMPANIAFQLSENFLGSFLPSVATRKNIGRVSALGWTMGYLGSLLILTIIIAAMLLLDRQDHATWRPFYVFAGLWFMLGMIPTLLIVKDDTTPDPLASRNIFLCAFERIASTVKHAARFRQLALFLIAFLIYGFGVQVIIAFASLIGEDMGFTDAKLMGFLLQITVVAGISAFFTSWVSDKLGVKNTVLGFLAVWVISTVGLLLIQLRISQTGSSPESALWVVGNGLGFALGGVGAATRAMIGQFTPKHKAAEFFGLWGLTNKLAGAIGVLSFSSVKAQIGDVAALGLLASFFVVGGIGVLLVNERAGTYAARLAERERNAELSARPQT